MEESIEIAYTFSKTFARSNLKKEENIFLFKDIHIHIGDGGTVKDGPSAGVAIVTGKISSRCCVICFVSQCIYYLYYYYF